MHKKILLIIGNQTLRQLYHELLSSKGLEVIATENITHALLMFTIHDFSAIIIYTDEETETKTFLKLRQRQLKWQVPLVLLTPEPDLFQHSLYKNDLLFNSLLINTTEIIDVVKTIID